MKTKNICVAEKETSLIVRAQQGDFAAFEELIETHRPALLKQARRKLKNQEDVHDAVQDALVKAFRAIRSFDPNRPLLPWLQRITTNCAVDVLRQRKYDCDHLDDHAYCLRDPSMDVVETTERNLLRQQIMQAIRRMPRRYKDILEMRHVQHLEVNEIALRLQKPEGTVKSWLFRARELLKKELAVA